jgi:hypothetical protein
MANLRVVAPTFTADQESAAQEIRRQLSHTLALITGAKTRLEFGPNEHDSTAIELLDIAEGVISNLEYIDRLAPELPAASEVAND